MRPVAALAKPQPMGPIIDSLALREFRILVPPDGPAGITMRWQPIAAGQPIGPEESIALASDEIAEIADTTALSNALLAFLERALRATGRSVARTEHAAEPVRLVPQRPDEPGVRLG